MFPNVLVVRKEMNWWTKGGEAAKGNIGARESRVVLAPAWLHPWPVCARGTLRDHRHEDIPCISSVPWHTRSGIKRLDCTPPWKLRFLMTLCRFSFDGKSRYLMEKLARIRQCSDPRKTKGLLGSNRNNMRIGLSTSGQIFFPNVWIYWILRFQRVNCLRLASDDAAENRAILQLYRSYIAAHSDLNASYSAIVEQYWRTRVEGSAC